MDAAKAAAPFNLIVRLQKTMSSGWKIYFWIIALQLLGVPIGAYYFSSISIMDIANWVFVALGVVGLYGFVYQKALLTEKFWKLFLPAFVIWDILFLVIWLPNQVTQEPVDSYEIKTLFIFLIVLPQYIGIYRYAFNRLELWQNNDAT